MGEGNPVGQSPTKIWELRYTGSNTWHKIQFGSLERFILSHDEPISKIQEIRIGVLE